MMLAVELQVYQLQPAMVHEGFGLLEIQKNVAFHPIRIKISFYKKKNPKILHDFHFLVGSAYYLHT